MAARPTPSSPPGAPDAEDPANDLEPPPPLTPTQEKLCQDGLPMVEKCAREIARRFHPLVEPCELLAAGAIALRQSAACYTSDLHASFPVYARHHIRGRMIDAVRSEHFSLRARVERSMERAYEIFESYHPVDGDLFADDDQKLLEGARKGCDELLGAVFLAGVREEMSQTATAEDELSLREEERALKADLERAKRDLPTAQRTALQLVYEQGMTIEEAAREMRVHRNTVQRYLTRAVQSLKAALIRGP
jgi:RNA polymerase sigma factor (sigma-70 family)